MTRISKSGTVLAVVYALVTICLIATQGLFGESFIALILGLPWSMAFSFFEFGNASGGLLTAMVVAPLVLNAVILYAIGALVENSKAKYIVLPIIIGVLVLVGGFFAFNHYIYTEKQADHDIVSYRGTLTGEYVCLPHKDTDGPQTLECALGMKTDAGEYYAVDFSTMSQMGANLNTGDRFTANGLITPVEMLSSDHWQKYNIVGIFSVTDSVQKMTNGR